jgi:hypothetical protein
MSQGAPGSPLKSDLVDPHAKRTYRSSTTLWSAVAGSIGSVAFLVGAITPGTGHLLGYGIPALFVLALSWRLWVAGIHPRRDGVKLVGILVSRTVPWDEIDCFEVRPLGGVPFAGYIVLRDGKAYGGLGLAAGGRFSKPGSPAEQRVQGPVDELNELLAAQRSKAPAGSPLT